jgi:hypothetical protein
MDEVSEHDALIKLQIERDTSRQVGDILNDFKKDIDAHFARLEEYLEARPTSAQVENAVKRCIDDRPIVYEHEFYDMWVKAKDAYTEKTTGKTKNWLEVAKGIVWAVAILIGVTYLLSNSVPAILKILGGN